jgi:hypothetical protein
MNPYRGEIGIEIAGTLRVLRFGWSEIALLQSAYGEDFTTRMMQAIVAVDLKTIADILVIGLRRDWPEVSAETIIEASPAIALVTEAINDALTAAFKGPKGVPDDPATRPTIAARMLAAMSSLTPSRMH